MVKNSPSAGRVFITGGAGYIGSVMVPILLSEGYHVTVLDNFRYGQNSLLGCCHDPRFEVVRGDCRREDLVRELIRDKDVLIPLAAMVGAPICDRNPFDATSINQQAVEMLVRVSSKAQRILIPNTNSGYGIGQKGQPCTEESPLKPISLYGRTKVAAETAVLGRGNAISFRLATVFGVSPRMRRDLLVNDFVYRALTDHAVVLFEGHFKRNYIHIRDVARVFLHGLNRFEEMKDRAYNVGLEDANLSKLELCEAIRRVLPDFVFTEAPIGEDPDKRDYIVSNGRILSTGFRPEYSLEFGIRELIRCYRMGDGVIQTNG
ncbi:MAG TPA: NAD(P)-dependent oxidoreductase [Elusimicrobiota bacterium]|nr:NAD(P)-dependent oxidoreductase [Elusimicrobiota bacterium]